jgi:ABC-type phosphate/phosphonate transport system permease subunit
LGSHKLFGKWAWISDVFLILIRTFPELLLGMMIVASAGPNAMAGVLASLHGIGMIGKLYAEQFDDIEFRDRSKALSAAGATAWQKVHLGIMPQARPDSIRSFSIVSTSTFAPRRSSALSAETNAASVSRSLLLTSIPMPRSSAPMPSSAS